MLLIPNTFFYVRFSPLSIGAKNGTIVVKSPNADSLSINEQSSGVNYRIPTTTSGYYNTILFKVKWQSVNGNRRVVIAKTDESVNQVPAGSFEYLANAN